MTLRSEIAESPAVVARLLDRGADTFERIARAARSRALPFALLVARGTSDHAATYAQYVLGARNRLPVALAAPSLTTVYRATPDVRDALVVGISQSGRSPDVVGVIAAARAQGALTVAITNDPASDLADAAEHLVDLATGPELAVAATKTYVAQLAAVALLSHALDQDPSTADAEALARLPSAIEAALGGQADATAAAEAFADLGRCVVLGRGFQYPTAREWSLKLKEIAGVLAEPYSAADFEHGPITLVDRGFPVLVVASSGPTLPGLLELVGRLEAAGADLLVASDDPSVRARGQVALALPADVPEWLAPIPSIVPAQLFAYELARVRGIDAERPRHLQKVTLTT
ncbi:MAG TPA: SIS domain-containing protein [Candidatus Limnocylindrales bacterium]|nr:SIS domain-containing protein [Candidatus Limnocylindrales bacterium]